MPRRSMRAACPGGARPVALLAALAATAWAAPGAAQSNVAAEVLFREGREAMRKGDVELACKRFAESHRLEPAAGTLLNLGDCHERLGRLASAWQAYTAAADLLDDERRAFAASKRDDLGRKVARVRLRRAEGSPRDCGFFLGETSLGTVDDVPIPVDAGRHTFELRCTGRAPGQAGATFVDGEERAVVIAPGAAQESEAPTTAELGGEHHATTPGVPGLVVASVVLGGLGLVAIGAGAATGALAIDRQSIVESSCEPGTSGTLQCSPDGVNAAQEGRTFATISTATFIGGAVALAASATLLVIHASSDHEPAARVHAWATPGEGGLRVEGAF